MTRCPRCASPHTIATDSGHQCLNCGFRWDGCDDACHDCGRCMCTCDD